MVRVMQTHGQTDPTERNRLFISRETRYPASQFGLQTFPGGAIHHMTMRPRVQGNWEQETGSYMSLYSAGYVYTALLLSFRLC
jgi:hypothetical protein